MKCPLCEEFLTRSLYKIGDTYYCFNHFYFDVVRKTKECFGFRLILENYEFNGFNAETLGYDIIYYSGIEIIKTPWIPVESPQDVLNLFHKLLKLKAFI